MNWFFANPWGLVALAGIPVVIGLHCLRRKSRSVSVNTLFLLPDVPEAREGGRRLMPLRLSTAFWVQVAAVVVTALLMAGPRWVDPFSRVVLVAVFDASASAGASRGQILTAFREVLSDARSAAGAVEWTAIDSLGRRLASGTGSDVEDIDTAWQPTAGAHNPRGAFALARDMAGTRGVTVFLTDEPQPGDTDIWWLARGAPRDNAAVMAGSADEDGWQAVLANFSDAEKLLRWRVEGSEWAEVKVPPRGTAPIAGSWPVDSNKLTVEVAEDALAIDNRLPLIKPLPKALHVEAAAGGGEVFQRMARIAGPASAGSEPPDVPIVLYDPFAPSLPAGAAVVAIDEPSPAGRAVPVAAVVENDPLVEGLDWSGLVAGDSLGIPFRDGDRALVWAGDRALIFLRPTDSGPQLIFNFNLQASNAPRLAAFPILLHRFFEMLRNEKVAPSAANTITGQSLHIAGAAHNPVQAPREPAFFEVAATDGRLLFEGAASFSDARESDLATAGRGESGRPDFQAVRSQNAAPLPTDLLLAFVLAALVAWNWWLTGSAKRSQAVMVRA